jgi:hypothetical protein
MTCMARQCRLRLRPGCGILLAVPRLSIYPAIDAPFDIAGHPDCLMAVLGAVCPGCAAGGVCGRIGWRAGASARHVAGEGSSSGPVARAAGRTRRHRRRLPIQHRRLRRRRRPRRPGRIAGSANRRGRYRGAGAATAWYSRFLWHCTPYSAHSFTSVSSRSPGFLTDISYPVQSAAVVAGAERGLSRGGSNW